MTAVRQYIDLTSMQLRSMRDDSLMIAVIHIALSLGLVVGMGYLIPDISDSTALFLITGTATQAFVTTGLVMLPQMISQSKNDGRLEYFLTMPISREAYLLSLITVVAITSFPGAFFALAFGAWHYDIGLTFGPEFIAVMFLTVMSLAGVGVAMAVFASNPQVTNALTQLIIFYVLFFSPVIFPASQLPDALQQIARLAPPTYAADGVRATLTDLPNTNLAQDLSVMAGFAAASVALSAFAIRRRG
ncbi:MAG: ABC transporter permease [Dehalococcoidia bacterium]